MRGPEGRNRWILFAGSLLAGLAVGSPALGLEWRSGDVVRIEATEIIRDDLYVGGSDVRVDGTVTGDVIAAGQRVRIAGEVRGNVWAAGETVTLAGRVGQSARLAGSVLRLESGTTIARDLLAGGAGLDVVRGARIGGDMAFGGSQVRLDGAVARNANLGATAVQLGGTIGGNARMTVGDGASWPRTWTPPMTRPDPLAAGLRVMPGGRVSGDLAVQMRGRPAVPPGAVGGRIEYQPPPEVAAPRTALPRAEASPLADMLRDFTGIALAALLLSGLARTPLTAVSRRLRSDPARSVGYGTLIALGLPLAVLAAVGVTVAVAALLTLLGLGMLGLPLGLIGAPTVLCVGALAMWLGWWLAQGLAATVVGQWALAALSPERPARWWATALLGALALAVVMQLPVLGAMTTLVALLAALGAIWLWWRPPAEAVPRPLATPHTV